MAKRLEPDIDGKTTPHKYPCKADPISPPEKNEMLVEDSQILNEILALQLKSEQTLRIIFDDETTKKIFAANVAGGELLKIKEPSSLTVEITCLGPIVEMKEHLIIRTKKCFRTFNSAIINYLRINASGNLVK
jgi:hypothetical protein